ncbi:MAG: RHS repeat-associated core domain-containing protein, partial [Terriglobia bacterium]
LVTFNGSAATYSYDGDGRRVKKVVGSATTVLVYDARGQMVAEYSNQAPPTSGGTSFLTADHLGSTRLVTDSTGAVIARHDYAPFGEEITSVIGGRGGVTGYGVDEGLRQKFTGKERDTETGLDYFGARYYGSSMGRFTSPDPKMISRQRLFDPQQWNMYQYGRNNPITMVDPDGREVRIATQELQKSFDHLMKSSKFSNAVAPFQGKGKPDLIIQRGQLPNDRVETERPTLGLTKSSIVPSIQTCSSATDCTSSPAKLKEATVTIDDRVKEGTGKEQIDGVLGHEISHVNDSEKDPQGSIDETNRNANLHHDDRSEEQRADGFSNDVRKEVKQEEKREKKEKKENPD